MSTLLPFGTIPFEDTSAPISDSIGTDYLMGEDLSRKVAEALDAYLLPVLPFGNSQEHQDFFGTVWLQPTTLRQALMDICRSLKSHGIRKILVMEWRVGTARQAVLEPL